MVQEELKKIIIICGPTAVGKTAVAIELAKHFTGEIVNADSGQVWSGLNVGTAKPSDAERAQVPHHLLDVASPDQQFDASKFVAMADEKISEIKGRGKNAFVVGGTGMYLRMLVNGLCDAPPRNAEMRARLAQEIEESGVESLHARLSLIDPYTAKIVHENDKTRIVRALEIYESTGVAASEFYRQHQFATLRYNALKIGLDMPRKELYARIDERVDKMLSQGWLDEVKGLLAKYGAGSQAFSAIGYRELAGYLSNEMPFEDAVDLIKRNSRRFAKRQLTWFRADGEIKWHTPLQISAIIDETSQFLGSN